MGPNIFNPGAAANDGTGTNLRQAAQRLNAGGVISRTTTAEPGSPTANDFYIVPASATGTNWAGQDNDFAWYNGTSWEFFTPVEGAFVWVNDTNQLVYWDGSAWTQFSTSAVDTSFQTLTDGATVNWDMSAGKNFRLTLGGNRTLALPTNLSVGDEGMLEIVQDGTGSRILTWNDVFGFDGDTAPTLATAADERDLFKYYVTDAQNIFIEHLGDYTPEAGAEYFLTTYPDAYLAYSLRRLASGSTNAIRVRDDGDGSSIDVALNSGIDALPDWSTFLTAIGNDQGNVNRWYDQSATGINAEQTNASRMPVVKSSGGAALSNIHENFQGNPCVQFTSNGPGYDQLNAAALSSKPSTVHVLLVISKDTGEDDGIFFTDNDAVGDRFMHAENGSASAADNNAGTITYGAESGSGYADLAGSTRDHVYDALGGASNQLTVMGMKNVSLTNFTDLAFGGQSTAAYDAGVHELIVWDTADITESEFENACEAARTFWNTSDVT